ncbi:MAG: PAS-domain containing protein, partial [Alphaproteobacteria bacterium]|nr:PAS-domain containing protein [Alphaproteobacteria bacterium]
FADLLAGKDVVHVPDLAASCTDNKLRRAVVDLRRSRTGLNIAVRKNEELLGVIAVGRQQVRPFSEAQIARLKGLAAQAAIAIENARLLADLRQRTNDLQESLSYQTATAEVLRIVTSSPHDLKPVFEAILDRITELCSADAGNLWLYDAGGFTPVAMRNPDPEAVALLLNNPFQPGPLTALCQAAKTKAPVHVPDIAADDAYRAGDPFRIWTLERVGVRSLLAAPLLKQGEMVGAIVTYRSVWQPFTDNQIALVRTFADQAVIAIENGRLFKELRERTDELAQRQAELRVTFDNMAHGVAMFDSELRLAAWNRQFQEMLDLPEASLVDLRTYADFIRFLAERGEFGAGADPEAELQRYTANAARHYSFERTRPDGTVLEIRHNPMPEGGFVLIYSDITARKRAEAEIRAARDAAERALAELQTAQASLLHAQKMAALGQLTAGIAHEIKNPLNFVNNFSNLSVELLDEFKETTAPALAALEEDKRADADELIEMLTGNLEKIAEHGRRADGIVKSMLEHSRGSSGERREIDLNDLVEEALNLAYDGARAQDPNFNITLERNFDRNLVPIEIAPQDITRVFLNLFGNGFYAANKRRKETNNPNYKPTLTVTTSDLGGEVEIRVRDNGGGIAPEHRNKLFQPFFTTKPTGEGTGLGLSISYDIVTQQHGGRIEAASEVGAFTEFSVRLPRVRHVITTHAAA